MPLPRREKRSIWRKSLTASRQAERQQGSLRPQRAALALVALVSLQSCRTESIPPTTSGAEASWVVASEPQLVIGVLDGDPAYQFSGISAIARQRDGGLIVADAGSSTVRTYDSEGKSLRLLGGPGTGPGEFVRPTQVMAGADGSILVWDDATYRVTEFNPEGDLAHVRTFSRERIAKAVELPMYPASGILLNGGDLIVRLTFKTGDVPSGSFRRQSGALRVASDQSVIDTVLFFPDIEEVSVDLPKGQLAIAPPLARRTSIAVQPNEDRICIGDQDGPEVRCFGPDGSAVPIKWEADPVTVKPNDPAVASWRDSMLDLYMQKMNREDADRILSQVPAPVERPPYSEMVLDRGGHLWVKTGTAAADGSETDSYLVFDSAGRPVGPVSVPPVRILEIGDDYLVGVARDEVEVQYVQVFEIAKPD